jgi:anti-sigma B factor antagonist
MTVTIRQRIPLPQLTAQDRGGVTVVSLRGELDFLSVPVLQANLSDIRHQRQARSVADLSGLAFIDCACLSVLALHDNETQAQGGSFALAGPQGAVRRILSVTGLLTWFEVHDTVGQAIAGGHQPLVLPPALDWPRSVPTGRGFGPAAAESAIGPLSVRRSA